MTHLDHILVIHFGHNLVRKNTHIIITVEVAGNVFGSTEPYSFKEENLAKTRPEHLTILATMITWTQGWVIINSACNEQNWLVAIPLK